MKLKNKISLVTGATGQLGKQFCHALAQEGATVCVSDLDKSKCDNVVSQLDSKAEHYALELDVANHKSVKKAISDIKKKSKKLDILINNAGIAVFTSFEERSFDDFMHVLKVNVGGTFLCIKETVNLLKLSNDPSIINIGSIYGMVSGDPRVYTDCNRNTSECYAASKAGVIQMTKYFAIHLSKYNIRVNCISPGGVFNNQGKDFVREYSFRTPMGRMANETEISDTLIFLSSNKSSYITGQNIAIDGGWTSW